MMRFLAVMAILMSVLGAIVAATNPAISQSQDSSKQGKPPGATGNGSLFAHIGL